MPKLMFAVDYTSNGVDQFLMYEVQSLRTSICFPNEVTDRDSAMQRWVDFFRTLGSSSDDLNDLPHSLDGDKYFQRLVLKSIATDPYQPQSIMVIGGKELTSTDLETLTRFYNKVGRSVVVKGRGAYGEANIFIKDRSDEDFVAHVSEQAKQESFSVEACEMYHDSYISDHKYIGSYCRDIVVFDTELK